MLRYQAGALIVLLIAGAGLRAEEVQADVLKADAEKGILTVRFPNVPGVPRRPNREFRLTRATQIVDRDNQPVKEGLKATFFQKPGGRVIVTVVEKDGKELVQQVKALINPSPDQ